MAAVLESPRCRARVWLASSEAEADREEAAQLWQERFEQLCAETRGVVEKLSRSWRSPSSVGTKQLVVWQVLRDASPWPATLRPDPDLPRASWLCQPRLLFCEADGICYQKLAADDTPMGEPTKVKFADVNGIEELGGHSAEFELRCAGQELIFKAASQGPGRKRARCWHGRAWHGLAWHVFAWLKAASDGPTPYPLRRRGRVHSPGPHLAPHHITSFDQYWPLLGEGACTTLVLNLRQLQELQGRYAAAEAAYAAADAEAASPHTSVRSSVQSASSRSSVHSPEA